METTLQSHVILNACIEKDDQHIIQKLFLVFHVGKKVSCMGYEIIMESK